MNLKQYLEQTRETRAKLRGLDSKRQEYSIALGAALAIQNLHAKKILHRDINPNNFYFTESSNALQKGVIPKVDVRLTTDALQLEPNQSVITGLGVVGTKGYIAPEIAIQGEFGSSSAPMVKQKEITSFSNIRGEYSSSSDIYALGVMFRDDLKLATEGSPLKPLIDRMVKDDPSARPTMSEIVTVLKNPGDYKEFEKTYTQLRQYGNTKTNTSAQLTMVADLESVLNRYRENKKNNVGDLKTTTTLDILKVLKENQNRHDKSMLTTASSFNLQTIQNLPPELKKEVIKTLKIPEEDLNKWNSRWKLADAMKAYNPVVKPNIPQDKPGPTSLKH